MTDDQVTMALEEIRERWSKIAAIEVKDGVVPEPAPDPILKWHTDIPRLLAAVERVRELADGAYVMLANCETGHREPVAWDLDPDALRDAISEALLGSQPAPAGEGAT